MPIEDGAAYVEGKRTDRGEIVGHAPSCRSRGWPALRDEVPSSSDHQPGSTECGHDASIDLLAINP